VVRRKKRKVGGQVRPNQKSLKEREKKIRLPRGGTEGVSPRGPTVTKPDTKTQRTVESKGKKQGGL